MTTQTPDWENFSKAVFDNWPTGDLGGDLLFDLAFTYGMIKEVPGGYDPERHGEDHEYGSEPGDPWYEYTFKGGAGPGLFSVVDMEKRIEELEAKLARAVEAFVVIDALDPEGLIDGCSQSALRGLVLRMGETARAAIKDLKGGDL